MVDEGRYFEQYSEGWNTHDPDMVVAQFATRGTYDDPNVEEPLKGAEIGDYVAETIEGFPDVNFEETRVMPTEIDGEFGLVAEWTMRGTHTGSLAGLPPTGRTIALDGVDGVLTTNRPPVSLGGWVGGVVHTVRGSRSPGSSYRVR